jgi:hypothetical protein
VDEDVPVEPGRRRYERRQGNQEGLSPSISADGRFVAFYSGATNLVPGDTNGAADAFRRGPLRSR